MTLVEAIHQLDSLDQESTIYAAEPWTEHSLVIVENEPELGGLPKNAEDLGFQYFIEVFIAKEFLDGWVGSLEKVPTPSEKTARLIQYAINDA